MCGRQRGWYGGEPSGGLEGVDVGLKGGIRCRGRSIVCKDELGRGQNGFKEVKEGLDGHNGIRITCVEDMVMLAEVRM